VPANYLAVCTGTLMEQLVDEENFNTIYSYDVSKNMSINHVGIAIGEFQNHIVKID